MTFGSLASSRPVLSWASALFATAAVATLPRLLYHGHAETLDVPVTALVLVSAVALWRCLEAPA